MLKIGNIKRENDKMIIKCRTENIVGTSEDSKQLILSLQPMFEKYTKSAFGKIYQTLTISCEANNKPSPCYIWVKSKANEVVGVGNTLEIVVSKSTEGEYACKAISGDVEPNDSLANSRNVLSFIQDEEL